MKVQIYHSGNEEYWCFEVYLDNNVYIDSGFIYKHKWEAEKQVAQIQLWRILNLEDNG